ncbi:MAG: phosphate acetyltransferase, partial [Aeriscardovia aeriphila]|nr:phosphate acetyltransferase [Aeriscardovia aeriphila]
AHLDAIIDQHLAAFQKAVEPLQLLPLIVRDRPRVLTPANFQYRLMHQAAQQKKTIILPEGDDDRILRAADYLLEFNAFHAVIVGDASQITRHAEALGLTHVASQATIQSMNDEELISRMVPELVRIRAKHGMTEEQAREALKDPSTFGTMYVQLGLADGMVSGARHSTANTVRPALQIIKTRPGIKLASGVMVMCLGRRVDIYADVALLPNPTASQLAEIAGESARTARQFGLDPYIGMLSYSTVDSGKGPDVDLVKEATQIAKEAFPKEKITGPIQFDAAWDATVAALKAPGDSVAGHVNTFVMPSLSASNIGIKAIQRVGEGVAIGPILQGLNKPVNDLSRGATTRDIINTIALTCVQAQAPQNV